jgi:hypothetical protein
MNDEKGYNGWKNYETWCVALWIDNEESTYNWACEVVRDHKELYEAADVLKECIEEMNPLRDTSTMWTDLMNAALSEVDWYEIAEHYKEEE